MFTRKTILLLACLLLLTISFVLTGANSPSNSSTLAKDVYKIFRDNCYKCHGQNGVAMDDVFILNRDKLVSDERVIPGNQDSVLYNIVDAGDMPSGKDRLPDSQIETIRQWIIAGAPAWLLSKDTTSQKPLTKEERSDLIHQLKSNAINLWNNGKIKESLVDWNNLLQIEPTDSTARYYINKAKQSNLINTLDNVTTK